MSTIIPKTSKDCQNALKKTIKEISYYSDYCVNFPHFLRIIFILLLEKLVGSYDTSCCLNLFISGLFKTLMELLLLHRA